MKTKEKILELKYGDRKYLHNMFPPPQKKIISVEQMSLLHLNTESK